MLLAWVKRHSDVGLICKPKFLVLTEVVDILVFLQRVLRVIAVVLVALRVLGEDLLQKSRVVYKELLRVDLGDGVDRDVWRHVLEAAVNKHVLVYCPYSVPEALDRLELVPLGGLCVVDLKSNVLSNLISPSSEDHHEWAQEKCGVLVPRCWSLACFVGSLNPVPSSVTVASKAPRVAEARLVSRPASEADHHAGGATSLAQGGRVINPGSGLFLSAIKLVPGEGRSLN